MYVLEKTKECKWIFYHKQATALHESNIWLMTIARQWFGELDIDITNLPPLPWLAEAEVGNLGAIYNTNYGASCLRTLDFPNEDIINCPSYLASSTN